MEKAQENQSPKGTLKMVSSRAMYTLSSFSLKTPVIYAIRMANFNFLAQPIITILFSLRYSRQNKSSSSTWCQSLSSLNGMVVRVNVNFERRVVVWIESWSWMICEEDVCWVGIPRTCSFVGVFLLGQSRNGVFSESLFLFHVGIMKKFNIINTTRFVTWFRLQA